MDTTQPSPGCYSKLDNRVYFVRWRSHKIDGTESSRSGMGGGGRGRGRNKNRDGEIFVSIENAHLLKLKRSILCCDRR